MGEPIIHTEGLTKVYGRNVAVDHVALSVEQGEVFGLLGPNGSGKTTTILMLLGLTEPTEGSVTVAGFDPFRQPLEVKRRVGYLPDHVGFYDQLSGVENMRYTARLCGIPPKDVDASIKAALSRVRLVEAARRPVKTFSHGMRQRLGIAEIIMKGAMLAILDEPTGGLDPQATQEFLDLVHSLRREGMTILLSSHYLEQVQSVCDRVALFNKGRIGLVGRVDELRRDVLGGSHVVRVEATGPGIAEAIAAVPGVTSVAPVANGFNIVAAGDLRCEIAGAVVRGGGDLYAIDAARASLADVYTRYFEAMPKAA